MQEYGINNIFKFPTVYMYYFFHI